ncbi:RagB/SusD family nutrient uptake outer membrane protein [Pedobacter sp. HMWF019]|uniref:RagB/SusD family nutrient uptake outer membrane protein n=1 Tax=Pedobacter sp. HMWF019 TaxID=2056856 RepID=UPI000D3759D2|nr:RagB/SusD family nutrient uptake outer membrane protein [Pedobacter sp. HMWF019]PTT01437.1 RagB/SusD family nutrient uptake outer membrane protein [Pedobacter sp. HMWF019]
MKTNINIKWMGAFVMLLTIVSCKKDFLNRPPQDQLSDATFWKTENDVFGALNTVYSNTLGGEGATIYEDAKTDNAYGQYPWESTATVVSSGDINSASDAGWDFTAIRSANLLLENADKATMDATRKERYKAEARFLRAYSYLDLMNKFGDVPIITKTLTIAESDVKRDPKAQVYKFITDELDAVSKVLPASYAGGKYNDKGRVTKGAALALKSRAHLYNGDWQQASDAAQQVMGLGYELFKVTAETGDDLADDYSKWATFSDAAEEKKFRLGIRSYEEIFWAKNKQNSEVILDRQYIAQKDVNYLNTYLLSSALGGWSSVTPTQELVDAYPNYKTGEPVTATDAAVRASLFKANDPAFYNEYKNRDPRFYASILFVGSPWNTIEADYTFSWNGGGNNNSSTGYNFRKLTDPEIYKAQLDNYSNIILIRYAEVLLTYAEAQNELSGPNPAVYKAIDDLRDRAGMPHVDQVKYAAKDAMRELIRRERRVELALEGQRYMDIRRWKIAPQVMKNTNDIRNNLAQKRVWTDKLYLMPIPQKQMDISKNLTQNPGY